MTFLAVMGWELLEVFFIKGLGSGYVSDTAVSVWRGSHFFVQHVMMAAHVYFSLLLLLPLSSHPLITLFGGV